MFSCFYNKNAKKNKKVSPLSVSTPTAPPTSYQTRLNNNNNNNNYYQPPPPQFNNNNNNNNNNNRVEREGLEPLNFQNPSPYNPNYNNSYYYNQYPNFNFPSKQKEKEPMLILDVTGSMNYKTSENDDTPRNETVREAIRNIVINLEKEDSQAQNEEHGGGLRTITFSGGKASDIGDINSRNLQNIWNSINWSGSTFIVPAWEKLNEVYEDEFGERDNDEKPILMALIITDGEAEDINEFYNILSRDNNSYIVIALLGFGRLHDKAVQSFQRLEELNKRIRLIPFKADTNPQVISDVLIRMIN
jgi:hypothetical protein